MLRGTEDPAQEKGGARATVASHERPGPERAFAILCRVMAPASTPEYLRPFLLHLLTRRLALQR